MEEAIAATMLLDRAAEIAGIAFGVWGFEYRPDPVIHRPLAEGHNSQGQRRIAGMKAWGDGTVLHPIFRQAAQTLAQRQEQLKLLILFHDGGIQDTDASCVRDSVQALRKKGIYVQPIFIGDNPYAVELNKQVFGHVLACPSVGQLTPLLRSWLHALF